MSEIKANFLLAKDGFSLDVSFSLPEKGITALFGQSGSGKTTILRCIAGLEVPDHGGLKVGEEIWQDKNYFAPVHKRDVGYVFQDANLFEHLTIEKNLHYGLKRSSKKTNLSAFEDTVQWLRIGHLLSRKPSALSGGQRQRVAIARALLCQPKLLLMDEPLASLDLQSKSEILPYLESLQTKLSIPIIYVSHSPNEVVRIADHMLLLKHGKVLASGAVNDLMTRTDLPLAHLEEACSVVTGKVMSHDQEYHLTYINLIGGIVAVSRLDLCQGQPVKVRIVAKDVSLSLAPGEHSTITNIFPVRVVELTKTHDPAKLIVKLDMGQEYLLAQITVKSAATLHIQANQLVYAQVKSVALIS